ncbi:hypothetical protein D9M68_459610 [compost metagenome]
MDTVMVGLPSAGPLLSAITTCALASASVAPTALDRVTSSSSGPSVRASPSGVNQMVLTVSPGAKEITPLESWR